MPTHTAYGYDDDDDDEDDDDGDVDDADGSHRGLRPSELPDDADVDESADDDTVPCPYCGNPVYEFADVCPHCRSFVSLDAGSHRRPRWLLIGVVLALLVVVVDWIIHGIWWM